MFLKPGYPDPGANWYYLPPESDGTLVDPDTYLSTTWNLPVTSFSHEFKTESVQLPLPVEDKPYSWPYPFGELDDDDVQVTIESNELEQLRNKLLDYGMRSEHIVIDGKLTTERNASGVSDQPTRKDLLNAIRGQWVVTLDGPGGIENPLNYLLFNVDGEDYRVFVTNITTSRRGGFTGVWDYKLSLYIVKNPNPW